MKSIAFLDKLSKVSLYVIAVLLPLWFLPLTQNILVYQKQALLVVLVFLGLIAWLAKVVNQGELQLRLSWLQVPALLLVLVVGVSTLFSSFAYGSFWGWPLDLTDNFLTLLVFVLLSFLVSQSVQNHLHLFRLFVALLISSALALLFAVLQLYQLFVLPFDFARSIGFNTLGNINAASVFASVLLPLSLVLAFTSRLLMRWILWAVSLVLFAAIVLINFQTAWVALVAGLLVLLAFGMLNLRKRAEFGWVSFPMALIIVAVFFMVFQVSLPGSPRTPVEVSPSQGATWNIAKLSLKESPVLGAGPGTFQFQYAKHRSAELNQTAFFGTRFASGASELLDSLVTKGVVGLAAVLLVLGGALVLGFRMLVRREEQESASWMLGLGVFASLVAFIVSFVLYPTSFILWFVFWMLFGALAFLAVRQPRLYTVTTHPFMALGSSFVFLLVLIFGLGLLFIGGQKYVAEARYLQGARASAQGNVEEAIPSILSAASLNPSGDLYWRDLSQLYLSRVNQISANQELSREERAQQTQTAVSNAVASTRAATQASPANVANWNVQGFVYRSLIGVEGAEGLAQQAYERAAELEPQSPFPLTELARVHVLQAQNLSQQQGQQEQQQQVLNSALEALRKAIELKADYAPAHYLTAVVYNQQGNSEEAVAKLEETKEIAPNDVGLAFQLGVLYRQREELDKAQAELERAKEINANYANARYILGLVYDEQGNAQAATEEFTFLAQQNPGNQEVQQILSNLQEGLPALEGITPGQPPLEETPPEIQEPEPTTQEPETQEGEE